MYNVELNISCNFINRRLGILKINNLAIIGCYLPHNDNQNNESNDFEFNMNISLLDENIAMLTSKGYNCMLIGDFNVDLEKENSRRSSLCEMLKKYKLVLWTSYMNSVYSILSSREPMELTSTIVGSTTSLQEMTITAFLHVTS